MVLYSRPGDDINRGLVGFWKLDDLKRIPSDGIVAHYKMNDNLANTDVIDSKGGNTGTASANTDTMSVVGKINEALDFDAANSEYVELPSSTFIIDTNDWSTSFWFNADAWMDNVRILSLKKAINFDVRLGSASTALILTFGGDANTYVAKTGLSTGTWYNVVVAFRASDNTVNVYIDGNLEDTRVPTIISDSRNNIIASNALHSGNFFDGKIDDFRIYDRELSQPEVDTIYNSNSGTETTELFRQDIVAIDRANFNDGTITGATNTEGINGLNPDAMFFDGVDDGVDCNDIPKLSGAESCSISAWFKGLIKVGNAMILTKGSQIRLVAEPSGEQVRFVVQTTDNAWYSKTVSSGNIGWTDNEWRHIVGMYNGSELKIYVDGELKSTTTGLSGNLITATQHSFLGTAGTNNFLKGSLRNIRVYNRALTDGEVSKLHRLRK